MDSVQNNFLPALEINWSKFIPDLSYLSTVSFSDVIDIIIVAYVIYRIIKVLKDTSAERLVKGILILAGCQLLATFFQLTMISYLLRTAFLYGAFVLVIIFQPELRRLLEQLGKGNISRLFINTGNPDLVRTMITAITAACADMSATRTGALIVCERAERLGEIVRTGTLIKAEPSPELIKNIFYPKSPLHDGAMIVRDGMIYAAGCVLPLSGNQNLSRDLGTRHRAAVGMSETADSVLVVVSEETGAISVATDGMLKRHLSPEVLQRVLETELLSEESAKKSRVTTLRDKIKEGRRK